MKRLSMKALLGGVLLTSALVSCGQGSPAPDLGGLPPLATGITVRFDAAPADTYLTLSTEGGEVVYQKAVGEGARSFTPDLNDWRNLSSRAAPIKLSSGVTTEALLFLKWGMFQDKNKSGKPDDGEWLDRMTHDRVAYAEKAVKVEFDTETPPHAPPLDAEPGLEPRRALRLPPAGERHLPAPLAQHGAVGLLAAPGDASDQHVIRIPLNSCTVGKAPPVHPYRRIRIFFLLASARIESETTRFNRNPYKTAHHPKGARRAGGPRFSFFAPGRPCPVPSNGDMLSPKQSADGVFLGL